VLLVCKTISSKSQLLSYFDVKNSFFIFIGVTPIKPEVFHVTARTILIIILITKNANFIVNKNK